MNGYPLSPSAFVLALWADPSLISPTTQRLSFLPINHA
jgi:hypothetical protein